VSGEDVEAGGGEASLMRDQPKEPSDGAQSEAVMGCRQGDVFQQCLTIADIGDGESTLLLQCMLQCALYAGIHGRHGANEVRLA